MCCENCTEDGNKKFNNQHFTKVRVKNSKNVHLQYQHVITTVPGVRRRKYRHRRCRRSSGRQSSGFRAGAYAGLSSHHEAGVVAGAGAAAVGAAVDDGCAGGQHQAREATAEDSRRADAVESWRTPREDKHLLLLREKWTIYCLQ